MSGETEKDIFGWTVDTLHQHFQSQLDDLKEMLDERYRTQSKAIDAAFVTSDKAVQAALASAEKAVVKAETASDKRFESVNEFRAQLSDQANSFLPRSEANVKFDRAEKDIQDLKDRINNSAGEFKGSQLSKGNLYAGLAAVATLLGMLVLIANYISAAG